MAVEARHLNHLPSQLITNKKLMSVIDGNVNFHNQLFTGYGFSPLPDTLPPMYRSAVANSLPAKADSGLTYALPTSRKRTRDSVNPLVPIPDGQIQSQINNRGTGSLTFLGEDFSLQIQQQQLEIDRFIAQHTEKLRLEIEERRKRHSKRIIAVVEEGIRKRLRAKEEELERIEKLNSVLEEKAKSLYVENQIWRDLAQANEATANALRNNLEQALSQHLRGIADDAQSSCGSNYGGAGDGNEAVEPRWSLAACGGNEREGVRRREREVDCCSERMCRYCGEQESCVLVLPCRHLCLCSVCGPAVHACPVCNIAKNASVHVILSS